MRLALCEDCGQHPKDGRSYRCADCRRTRRTARQTNAQKARRARRRTTRADSAPVTSTASPHHDASAPPLAPDGADPAAAVQAALDLLGQFGMHLLAAEAARKNAIPIPTLHEWMTHLTVALKGKAATPFPKGGPLIW